MEDKICVIIPTRERLNDFKLFAESWKNTTNRYSDVIVGVDNNDNTYDKLIEENVYPFIWERVTPKPFLHILNELAVKYCYTYNYLAFLEDDVTFDSNGWETLIINKIKEIGDTAIVWPNELLNKQNLVGIPFMNSKIIQKLGHMSEPGFNTQVVDLYWLDLAKLLNTYYYFDNVIMEHRHYITGKRSYDNTAILVDSFMNQDRTYYRSEEYRQNLIKDYNTLTT
jgi:hypothetical protein